MTDRDTILDAIASSEKRTHERIDKLSDQVQKLAQADVRHDVELEHLKQPKRSITPSVSVSSQMVQTGAITSLLIGAAEAIRHLTGK